jgi:hypothetical protein
MGAQLKQSTSSDVLKSILATLQSLEVRFEDQNMRLGTIESSIVSSACSETSGSPKSPCSRHLSLMSDVKTPMPAMKALGSTMEHPAAHAYLDSVMELRKRFFLEGRSNFAFNQEVVEHSASHAGERYGKAQANEGVEYEDDDDDWYSQSVYSSRPLSRLEIDIPPTPPLPQKNAQRANSNCEPVLLYSLAPQGTRHVLAMRYEDTAESSIESVPSTSPHCFSGSLQDRTSFSASQRSASTGQTSISTGGEPSPIGSKRSVSSDLRGAYNNLKQSLPQASQFIKRSFFIRTISSKGKGKGKENSSEPEQVQSFGIAVGCMVPVTNLEEPHVTATKWGFSFFQLAERTARACRSVFPNISSLLTRESYFIPS